jgi:hypothetical protein
VPRFDAGTVSTGAGSTTLPVGALTAGASNDIYVVEIGVFNTTATAVSIAVRRLTSAGTPGSTVTSIPEDPDVTASTAAAKDTYTSTGPTITAGNYRVARLGAAIGSGVIWTFNGKGLRIPKGTANGLCIIPNTGTGQILDWYISWDE